MAGVTAHGATFSFNGIRATITGISVEMPTAEVADMTGAGDSAGQMVIVPTGAWSGGTITVDFLAINGDPQAYVKQTGQLTFASAGYSVSRRVLLESASVDARAGELVRGSLRFRMTDYMGR
jgi:hypothetical protein